MSSHLEEAFVAFLERLEFLGYVSPDDYPQLSKSPPASHTGSSGVDGMVPRLGTTGMNPVTDSKRRRAP
jgi:hypothetical protein